MNYIRKKFPNFIQVKIFKPGEGFGEIALITNSNRFFLLLLIKNTIYLLKRTATMICKEDTHLLTLSKEGFDKILGAYHEFSKRNAL